MTTFFDPYAVKFDFPTSPIESVATSGRAGSKLNSMKVLTYEAVVERGQVKLPETVKLPEHAKVYVVVPGVEDLPPSMIHTPHLLRPEQAPDFAMEIVEGEDAAVR